ncbi:MAG: hypothetical protein FK734_04435 [Asgard group archaeon]|nr:hypothetical protein [Asgard group archaeon]
MEQKRKYKLVEIATGKELYVEEIPEGKKMIVRVPVDGMSPNSIQQYIWKVSEVCQEFLGNTKALVVPYRADEPSIEFYRLEEDEKE